MSKSGCPEYSIWKGMNRRCKDPKFRVYKWYGGRGVRVCESWSKSFQNFLRDVGPRPSKKHSIDRIDVNLGYEPGNVRWATKIEQMNNTRSNVFIEIDGENKTIAQWTSECGLKYSTVHRRLAAGWEPRDAIFGPLQRQRTKN
jgi:hypothetical protein